MSKQSEESLQLIQLRSFRAALINQLDIIERQAMRGHSPGDRVFPALGVFTNFLNSAMLLSNLTRNQQ